MESRKSRIQESKRSIRRHQKKSNVNNFLNTKEITQIANNFFLFFEKLPNDLKKWKEERKKKNKSLRFINAFVVLFVLFILVYSTGLFYVTHH